MKEWLLDGDQIKEYRPPIRKQNPWELTEDEMIFAGDHEAVAHEAQKKLFEWLDKEGYLNIQVDAYYKLCKALGRIDGR